MAPPKALSAHAIHQQRCENHVQLAALVAATNVGEDRRTWRAIALSCIMRVFNKKAVDAKRVKEPDPKKKSKSPESKEQNEPNNLLTSVMHTMKHPTNQ